MDAREPNHTPAGARTSPAPDVDRGPVDVRVLLAAERTFLAWIRTGVSLMGFGFVVARFDLFLHELAGWRGEQLQAGHSRWFGVALVALGAAIIAGALRHHIVRLRELNRGDEIVVKPSGWQLVMPGVLIVFGLLLTLYLAATSLDGG